MKMVKVKILGTVITQQYGSLSDGDILTTSEEFAKHLVDDCKAAEYVKVAEKLELKSEIEQPAKYAKKVK